MKVIGRLLYRSIDNKHYTLELKRLVEPFGFYITQKFVQSIGSGRWGDKNLLSAYGVPVRIGITQPINRFMPLSTMSQLRKVNTPVGRDTKLSAPRQLHGTHFGIFCPSETPEGHSCGLVKTLSILTKITLQIVGATDDLICIINAFCDKQQFPHNAAQTNSPFKLIISGHWYTEYHLQDEQAQALVLYLRQQRRQLQINAEIGICVFTARREIHLQLDGGRLIRPLWVADNFFFCYEETMKMIRGILEDQDQDILVKLLENGLIEYVGADEEESILICENLIAYTRSELKERIHFTHIEIHGVTILGLCALDVPFSNFSQAPRVSYQCLLHSELIRMANLSTKKISDVRVGDLVLSFDTKTLRLVVTQVIHQFTQKTAKKMIKISTADRNSIIVTYDHLFWTRNGWLCAQDLLDKEVVIFLFPNQQPVFCHVVAIETVNECMIADITVAHPDNCFVTASGFGVHNSSMMKQAIGIPSFNLAHRFDAETHTLHYPQKPLNSSSRWLYNTQQNTFAKKDQNAKREDDLNTMYGASGQNAIVAICSWSGFNQEDSLILNQSAVDRGLFHSTVSKTVVDVQKNGEEYKKPDRSFTSLIKDAKYEKLDFDGIAEPASQLDFNDALIGKTAVVSEGELGRHERDVSTILKSSDHTNHVVDAVCIVGKENYTNNVNYYDINNLDQRKENKPQTTKVKLRTRRVPEIGDKYCKCLLCIRIDVETVVS